MLILCSEHCTNSCAHSYKHGVENTKSGVMFWFEGNLRNKSVKMMTNHLK